MKYFTYNLNGWACRLIWEILKLNCKIWIRRSCQYQKLKLHKFAQTCNWTIMTLFNLIGIRTHTLRFCYLLVVHRQGACSLFRHVKNVIVGWDWACPMLDCVKSHKHARTTPNLLEYKTTLTAYNFTALALQDITLHTNLGRSKSSSSKSDRVSVIVVGPFLATSKTYIAKLTLANKTVDVSSLSQLKTHPVN